MKEKRKLSPHLGGELSESGSMKGDKMNFSIKPKKTDFEALNISKEQFLEDLVLLNEYGYNYDRNIIQYIHDVAEALRYCENED